MKKLSVGLIVDSGIQSHYVWDIFQRSKSSTLYSIDLLIVQHKAPSTRSINRNYFIKRYGIWGYLLRNISNRSFKFISKFEKRRYKQVLQNIHYLDTYMLDAFDTDILEVHPSISKSGLVYRYTDEDLQQIAFKNLGLLIRAGNGILKGGILDVAAQGIISIHHADNDLNRGAPSGFWQVYNRQGTTGFIVQILNEELDGGKVLSKGSVKTKPIYTVNKAYLYNKANYFLHASIENLARRSNRFEEHPELPYTFRLFRHPNIFHQSIYILKTISHYLKNPSLLTDFSNDLKGDMKIAHNRSSSFKSAVLWKSKTVDNIRTPSWPIIDKQDSLNCLFVVQNAHSRYALHAVLLDKNKSAETEETNISTIHPVSAHIFNYNHVKFIALNDSKDKSIQLFKSVKYPTEWEPVSTIQGEHYGEKSVFVEVDSQLWMISNIDSANGRDPLNEVHLFHNVGHDLKTWKAHCQNPVITDGMKGATAGLVTDQGNIFRVYSVSDAFSRNEYLGVSKITTLNESEYEEEDYTNIYPQFAPHIKSLRTLMYNDTDYLVIGY